MIIVWTETDECLLSCGGCYICTSLFKYAYTITLIMSLENGFEGL